MTDSLFPSLRSASVTSAVEELASNGDTERGAVYTKPEIVQAILDLAGYTEDRPLHQLRLLEPSFGGGDFLLPALDRLLAAFATTGGSPAAIAQLRDAVRAVEVNMAAFEATSNAVSRRLLAFGCAPQATADLVSVWLRRDDFLLASIDGTFDFVLGNPPYVRQERIPESLLAEYRRRYQTVYDRADLYVPFYERGLSLLAEGGRLGFICANRWLKNKYGGPLREFAGGRYGLRYFIDLEGSPAFQADVIAYPAITVFERGGNQATRLARKPEVSAASLGRLVRAMLGDGARQDARVEEVTRATSGSDPWLLDSPDRLRLLRALEDRFPTLEAAGCKVGIGVATGADKVFLGQFADLPVEDSRKLPLAMAADLRGTTLTWGGRGVINPFNDDGSLADLDAFPRFGAYIRANSERIAARHCAQKSETGWYRTIDRVWPALTSTPKLLIPDIKGEPTVVFDEGGYYPHHNLYYVVSDEWDLRPLGTVLRSSIADLFVSSYCVKMSGGFLRFQAQYIRRIRVPRWDSISAAARRGLSATAASTDLVEIDAAVAAAFGLSAAETRMLAAISHETRASRKPNAAPTPSH